MNLDRRKQNLLQQIVVTYVQRAEPVGSHFLASQELGVRSATIRNELAEMTDLGYLRQPHTSAGRIPSDLGYRYYVDHLMTWDRLSAPNARSVRGALKMSEGDIELLLSQTTRVLSSLTRYTSVATPPTSEEPRVRQAHLVQLGPRMLLTVAVLSTGQVVHRHTEVARVLTPSEVVQLSNALDRLLAEKGISAVAQTSPQLEGMAPYEETLRQLIQVIGRGLTGDEGEIVVDGASRFLEQPEFKDADRVEPLVRFLEQRRSAYEVLRRLVAERDIAISIGQEHELPELQEVSVVAARYSAGPDAHGWVAVVGPTRMHYAQAVPAVQFVAKTLTETLGRWAME